MGKRLLIILLMFALPTLAVEVQPGRIYTGGTVIQSSPLGVTFTIPNGWRGGWPAGSSAFVLDNDAGDATIMMVFDQFTGPQIASMMAQNIPLDDSIYLMPDSAPSRKPAHFENHYQVMGSAMQLNAFIAAKQLREGLSLATIIMTAKITDPHQSVVVELTNGMALSEPQAPKTDTNEESWQEYMKGRYIARYYTGSGYREKQELWFCSDGNFASSFNSGGFSMDGFSGAANDSNHGTWQASGSVSQSGTLHLTYANGNQNTIQLQLQDKLYLDGVQWLRGDNERCH